MEKDKKTARNIVRSYVRYLKLERNYSPNTLEAYQHDLRHLLDYCEREGKEPLALKLEDLQHFAATIHELGIGPTSQARILSGVRSFYRYLLLDGYIDNDPTELLESPRLGEHLPEVLSTEEVDQLEDSIDLPPTKAIATAPSSKCCSPAACASANWSTSNTPTSSSKKATFA